MSVCTRARLAHVSGVVALAILPAQHVCAQSAAVVRHTAASPRAAASSFLAADAPAKPVPLIDELGDSAAVRSLAQSLAPYLTASAKEAGDLLKPLDIPQGSASRREYLLGRDLVVMPPAAAAEEARVTLPPGAWVNFWTGAQSLGGVPFTVEVAGGALPVWARGGAVLERRTGGHNGRSFSFEKALTDQAANCGANCLLDVLPMYSAEGSTVMEDADDRRITRSGSELAVQGAPSHVTIRWRFTRVTDVRVNGTPVAVMNSPEGFYATFDHAETSVVRWTVRDYMPRSY